MRDEIDNIINEIEDEANEEITEIVVSSEEKEIEKKDEIDLEEDYDLANKIVTNSLSVIENAKMVFDNFSADVIKGHDRSTSSKETIIKALDVQNAANKNLIDLQKALAAKKNNQTNILVNGFSEKKAGISISNLQDYDDDD
ncbi:MAG: hypothetical protein ACOC3Z_00815 [Nanoarchaeota archaeon]